MLHLVSKGQETRSHSGNGTPARRTGFQSPKRSENGTARKHSATAGDRGPTQAVRTLPQEQAFFKGLRRVAGGGLRRVNVVEGIFWRFQVKHGTGNPERGQSNLYNGQGDQPARTQTPLVSVQPSLRRHPSQWLTSTVNRSGVVFQETNASCDNQRDTPTNLENENT